MMWRIQRATAFRAKRDFVRMVEDCDKVLQVAPADSPLRTIATQYKDEAKRIRKTP
jgi:hypothetical protein